LIDEISYPLLSPSAVAQTHSLDFSLTHGVIMLSTLIWLPVVGALLTGLLPGSSAQALKRLALLFSLILTGLGFLIAVQFDLGQSGLQFSENIPWIAPLGLNYALGVDGLSLPLVLLNSLLTVIVIYGSPKEVSRPRLYYSLILLVNAGITGAFVAQNLLLFFLFYEVELIPLYLLIAVWGGNRSNYAATKFLIYTAVSGILILGGFLGLTWIGHAQSFDYEAVQAIAPSIPAAFQSLLLLALILGFGIKTPLVPLHTWLPDAYVESSAPVSILLGGILAKLGTYGLFRFCIGLLPEAWANAAPVLALWAAITVIYGALAAIAQHDIKRMVAFSSIAHMGYVLLGGAALTELSLVGAVSQMVAHGFILALLFYLVGIIEDKVGTRELSALNGLMSPVRGLPWISALLVLGGMASAGIPGFAGFIAEFMVFQGSFEIYTWQTLLSVIGTGFTAVYFVILLNRTCFGRLDNATAYYPKVLWSERMPAIILAVVILFLGVQPHWLVRWTEPTTKSLSAIASAYWQSPNLPQPPVIAQQGSVVMISSQPEAIVVPTLTKS
jgi:NAD(P)H-quinone oxidoreductase subunit 4